MIETNPTVHEERAPIVEGEREAEADDHLTDGEKCWCMPTYETLPCGTALIIHNDHGGWS